MVLAPKFRTWCYKPKKEIGNDNFRIKETSKKQSNLFSARMTHRLHTQFDIFIQVISLSLVTDATFVF